MKIKKLTRIFPDAKYHDSGCLDSDECDDGERKRNIQIRVYRAQERNDFSILSVENNTLNAGNEFHPIPYQNKQKNRYQKLGESFRENDALKRFCDKCL